VCFAAYTGKAAHVMRSKGCFGAQTIHSLIYEYVEEVEETEDDDCHAIEDVQPRVRKKTKPVFRLNELSKAADADLIVIDECSMVDAFLGRDLLSFRRPILVLGDPAQLPPVKGAGYFTGGQPDHMLTEIRRQDLESPILRLATAVRQGDYPRRSDNPLCTVMHRSNADGEIWRTHDQVIVGTNEMRRRINTSLREKLRHGDWLPKPGERLICLRNNRENGLFNGQVWDVVECSMAGKWVALSLVGDDGARVQCTAHPEIFQGEEVPYERKRYADEFDFAYAITGHKSQGSEWGSVLAIDQSSVFKEDKQRWLYTVITRAAERLTLLT